MEYEIIHKLTPEQEELERKKAELAELGTELVEKELSLATFQAELNSFFVRIQVKKDGSK
jgi:hypothetical protein